MALNWQWSDKCGEIEIRPYEMAGHPGATVNKLSLYEGNAYLIVLREDEVNETYSLITFWADKEHMLRCLGLRKDYNNNIYADSWLKVRINKAKCRNYKQIVSAIAQAFDNITIEIYKEEQ